MNYQSVYNTLERACIQQGYTIYEKSKTIKADNGLGSLFQDQQIRKIILRADMNFEEKTKVLIRLLRSLKSDPEKFCHHVTEGRMRAEKFISEIDRVAVALAEKITVSECSNVEGSFTYGKE